MLALSRTQIAFIQLHISIILAGFTGICGKLISVNEGLLTWYRVLFTCVILALILVISKKLIRISLKDFFKIGLSGILLSLHWIFFYGSIKLSNVSIGVVCFSTVGFFTALLEPLFTSSRFSWREFAFSILTVLGVCLIFSFDDRYRLGIIFGIIAAVLTALYTIATRKLCANYPPTTTLLYQMTSGLMLLTLILPFYADNIGQLALSFNDIVLLLFLSIFCTIGMNILLIKSLQAISAFTVNLSYNLEPVYSIVIAMLFLGEARQLNFSFYLGIACIILSVILQTAWILRNKPNMPEKVY